MNYGEIRTSVRDHLWRSEDATLPDSILQTYILSAVEDIENRRRWAWLDDVRESISTSDDRIDVPTGCKSIRSIIVIDGNDRYYLDQRPIYVIRELWEEGDREIPQLYAWHGDEIHFWPRPDQEYTYELTYKRALHRPALTTQDALSDHLTDTYPLALIYRAAAKVAAGYLQDREMAEHFGGLFQAEIESMEAADDERRSAEQTSTIEPDLYLHVLAHGRR